MSRLKEMSLEELRELQAEKLNEFTTYHSLPSYEAYWEIQEVITAKLHEVPPVEVIEVTFELGYKWSVGYKGKESIETGLTKKEAMIVARRLKAFSEGKAIIEEQKLTKEERAENINYLRENTSTYGL